MLCLVCVTNCLYCFILLCLVSIVCILRAERKSICKPLHVLSIVCKCVNVYALLCIALQSLYKPL